MRTCTIDWCDKKYHWIWYCTKHYERFKKYWDVNFVKSIRWENRLKHILYSLYLWIRRRCLSPNYKNYKNYWWRWITLCDRWLGIDWFTNFCNDMWPRPEWYSIDRIDNDWPYSPENCRRATRHQQQANRRINNKVVWVTRYKNTWKRVARICIWKSISLWSYKRYWNAVKARKKAEEKYGINI